MKTKAQEFLERLNADAVEPVPPGWHVGHAGHHWLAIYDMDGHFFGHVVMQWQPNAKKWCHSGDVASGRDVETKYWKYLGECPMPEFK